MSRTSTIRGCAVVAAALLASLGAMSADAQTYRCVGKDGKKYYGQVPPLQCEGQPMEALNAQGQVIRRAEPAPPKKADAATNEKNKAQKLAAREESRRNAALLDTYANEKEIELARSRALEEINRGKMEIERRIAEAKKRQDKTNAEMEFYKGNDKPPAALEAAAQSHAADIKAQQNLLAHKLKEGDEINAKYDEDVRRFRELTGGK